LASLFYYSDHGSFTYEDLLQNVNSLTHVESHFLAKDYFSFISNTLKAVVNDIDITLLDYRNSTAVEEVSNSILCTNDIGSVDEMIALVLGSKSSLGIYSSGTEGKPKLIFQSITRLLKSVQIKPEYQNSKWTLCYNPSHSAGLQVFLQVFCNKACLYDLYKVTRSQVLDVLFSQNVEYISATPTFYRMLAPYDFKLKAIKSVTLNGEKSTQELIDKVKHIFPNARIRNIYGSTESGPLMSSENATFVIPSRLIDKIKIQEDQLFIDASIVSKSVKASDWYATGDLVAVKNTDPLTIEFISRKTRIINVGGQNVNPQEVEEFLLTHPFIKDVRVFGKASSMMGNVICAEVQLLENEQLSEKEIIDYCKIKLAAYKVPRIIKFVSAIQSGHTGKKLI
jgi:acyl-coenzyme A synthetase/AMP-(fatty) acid ligase